jgi:hypothetical protein
MLEEKYQFIFLKNSIFYVRMPRRGNTEQLSFAQAIHTVLYPWQLAIVFVIGFLLNFAVR